MLAGATIIALVILCGCLRCRLSYWRNKWDRGCGMYCNEAAEQRRLAKIVMDRSKAGMN